ncbi:Uncharacterized protein OBRU01_07642 [Operophtera brumata]|uniref:DH domain-containing protein n=1 Tax=Operophtera brumata TaxID=104452 RepID=A0A0L7LIG1_OPEBR|nr:Uncharacterized protein OBRU01_07642 [Operophtera brumata]
MTSSEPIETLNDDSVEKNSEKPCLRRENGEKTETNLSLIVQQKPRVVSFQVGWVQVIEELRWKLNKMETSGSSESSAGEDAEARRLRRGHVLSELMQTERVYVQELGSILHILRCLLRLATHCTMKYGKYDLYKSSANLSVGTSYSWYYRKNENQSTRKKKRLTRTASDSTLFSDYANQIPLFEKEHLRSKKCVKSVSDVEKHARVKYNPRNIKPVHMEPFTGNFFYGKPLPGYEHTHKTEEKITYLPDSDAVTVSGCDTAAESITTAPTVVDPPDEVVKNPLYGCMDTDIMISSDENLSGLTTPKYSQFKSSSCSELRDTTFEKKETEVVISTILKDYKRIMKEWNHTIENHCSPSSHRSKKSSTMFQGSNTVSYVRSLHSTLSCRKLSKCVKSQKGYNHYSYAYGSRFNKKLESNINIQRRTQSLNRNQIFTSPKSTTLQNLKKKTQFWKTNRSLSLSECKCLEAIYRDYDRRLQEWCDTISQCSSLLTSGYKEEIEKPENQHLLPATLAGQADVLFGNLHELFTFHQDIFLKDLEKSISATELVALCFVEKRETFFRLYSYYCQNIPRSERLRETLVDTHLFLQACQLRLGHKLPLAAYGECGSMTTKLQQALDCMLVVLKCVNDSMHQIAITGVPVSGSESTRRAPNARILPRRFREQARSAVADTTAPPAHIPLRKGNAMSQVGLTESVKGDERKFEVWRQGRCEVHTITAPTADVKRAWVERVKRVLLDQLKELKGERVRQYSAQHRTLIQTASWDAAPPTQPVRPEPPSNARTASCDTHDEPCWSTDPSDDEEEEPDHAPVVGCGLVALSDYTAVGPSEVSLREGQNAELLKVGCAGWWYVRLGG